MMANPFGNVFPNGFMPHLRNNSATYLQTGLGLLSGRTGPEQAAMAGQAFAQARQGALEKQKLNQTVQWLKSVNPQIAQAVEMGAISPADGYKMHLEAQKSEATPYTDMGKLRADLDAGLISQDQYNSALGGQGFNKEAFETEQKLRKEYTGEDVTKEYNKIRSSFERLRSSAQRASTDTTGASDLAIVFNYMKMLDPGSVVRESEFQTAALSGGYGAQMQNTVQSIVNGKRLTPQQRMEFVNTAQKIYEETQQNMTGLNEQYGGIAEQYGVDPSRLLREPETYDPIDLTNYSDEELEAIANGQ